MRRQAENADESWEVPTNGDPGIPSFKIRHLLYQMEDAAACKEDIQAIRAKFSRTELDYAVSALVREEFCGLQARFPAANLGVARNLFRQALKKRPKTCCFGYRKCGPSLRAYRCGTGLFMLIATFFGALGAVAWELLPVWVSCCMLSTLLALALWPGGTKETGIFAFALLLAFTAVSLPINKLVTKPMLGASAAIFGLGAICIPVVLSVIAFLVQRKRVVKTSGSPSVIVAATKTKARMLQLLLWGMSCICVVAAIVALVVFLKLKNDCLKYKCICPAGNDGPFDVLDGARPRSCPFSALTDFQPPLNTSWARTRVTFLPFARFNATLFPKLECTLLATLDACEDYPLVLQSPCETCTTVLLSSSIIEQSLLVPGIVLFLFWAVIVLWLFIYPRLPALLPDYVDDAQMSLLPG